MIVVRLDSGAVRNVKDGGISLRLNTIPVGGEWDGSVLLLPPKEGAADKNQKLSEQRAASVKKTLVAAGIGLAVGLFTPVPAAGFVALMLVAKHTGHTLTDGARSASRFLMPSRLHSRSSR